MGFKTSLHYCFQLLVEHEAFTEALIYYWRTAMLIILKLMLITTDLINGIYYNAFATYV